MDYPTESEVNSIINNYDIPLVPDNSQLLLDNNQNTNFSFNNQNTNFPNIPYIGNNSSEDQTQIDNYNLNINSQVSNIAQETSISLGGTGVDVNNEQPISENSKKQNLPKTSDDNHLEKEYRELEALSILSIMDLEKNPKSALLLKIEHNNKQIEELSKDKSKNSEYLAALNSREVYKIAKKWLVRFGSFTRLSEHFLKTEETEALKTPLQIKKEHIEEGEEEMPSCQFAEKSKINMQSTASELVNALTVRQVSLNQMEISSESLPTVNHIASLETQVDSIADQLNAAGVDCTIPIPGIAAMSAGNCLIPPNITRTDLLQDSRETPSRGSGPRTPARPESAASHTDERVFTPAQIKRERMESTSSPFAQCAYSGTSNTTVQLPFSTNASQVMSPSVSQSMAALSSLLSSSLSRVQNQPIVSQPDISQSISQLDMALRTSSVMPRQITTVAPNVSLMPNVSYTNQGPNFSIRALPQNVSTQITNTLNSPRYSSGTNMSPVAVPSNALVPYNPQIQNNYQNQIPPNRTIPYQNISKVVMNLVSQSQSVNSNVSSNSQNANMVFRNAQQGQLYIQQQQQQPVNPVYNVQQVYLPNKSPLLQQSLVGQPSIPSPSNSISLQQSTDNVTGGTILLNSVQMAGNNMQQSNPYSLANNIVANYPQPMNTTASIQQVAPPANQIPSGATTAYLMQNNNNKLSITATEENVTDMFCAMCNKVATLRCKQCAKVAYCNPTCAKTYWHTKHKMECRPLNNTV